MIANLNLESINLWAVFVATIAAFAFGAVWYAKPVFGNMWIRERGMGTPECTTGHTMLVFGVSFLLLLVAAAVFAITLGPNPRLGFAVAVGALVGLCWVSTAFGVNYLFAGRSFKLFLIDAGYHTIVFTLYGVILGLWH